MLLTGYSGQAYLGMGDSLPLHLDRRRRDRRRLDPRRQRPLPRHRRRRAGPDHPDRPPAGAEPLERRPPRRLRRGDPRHRLDRQRGARRPPQPRRPPAPTRTGRLNHAEITCVVDARAELGEGTLWDPEAQVLWWIDIWGPLIHRYDPATGERRHLGGAGIPRLPRPARPRRPRPSRMVSGFYFFDPGDRRLRSDRRPRGRPRRPPASTTASPTARAASGPGTMFEAPGRAGRVHRLALAPRSRPHRCTG